MKTLKAKENFTCYPDGDDKPGRDITEGSTFDIESDEYAKLLVDKGHATESKPEAGFGKTKGVS